MASEETEVQYTRIAYEDIVPGMYIKVVQPHTDSVRTIEGVVYREREGMLSRYWRTRGGNDLVSRYDAETNISQIFVAQKISND